MNDLNVNPTQNSNETKLKLTQISRYLSPTGSTFNKLNELSFTQDENQKKIEEKKSPAVNKKKKGLTKSKSSKLNFFRLNNSKILDESIIVGEAKYFQKSNSLK